jgi:hypothetical protein
MVGATAPDGDHRIRIGNFARCGGGRPSHGGVPRCASACSQGSADLTQRAIEIGGNVDSHIRRGADRDGCLAINWSVDRSG